jgi:thymidylate synthase
LYNDHLDQAKEYLSRPKRSLPQLELDNGIFNSGKHGLYIPLKQEIRLNNYNPLPAIKAPLSVGI